MLKDVYTIADLRNWREVTAGIAPPIRLAVFGDPVAHSKSPQMQNAALEACGIDAQYARLHIHTGNLAEVVHLLPEIGFVGANVTIPHKLAMLDLMDEVDDQAQKIGTINTIKINGGKLHGFNTDGPGLVRAVSEEFKTDISELNIMILGAGGGAGRAIAIQCCIEKCDQLVLVNRSSEKTKLLAEELRLRYPEMRIDVVPWGGLEFEKELMRMELVINASSVGMKEGDPSPLLGAKLLQSTAFYDTIYAAVRTPLMKAADEVGAKNANGLSMLLHQGALSFEIWFNREAPLDAMRKALVGAS